MKAQLTEVERFDVLLVYILTLKLDVKTIEAWEQSISSNDDFPTYDNFSKFLENHCRTQELVQSTLIKTSVDQRNQEHRIAKSYHSSKEVAMCIMCNKDNHSVFRCFRFRKLTVDDRVNFVKEKKLCVRCLSAQHEVNCCPHSYQCSKCNEPHSFLLHVSDSNQTMPRFNQQQATATIPRQEVATSSSQDQATPNSTVYTHHGTNVNQPQILLATAQVNITSANGQVFRLRALIDPGSQASLIKRSAANLLGLKMVKCKTTVKGLGDTTAGESSHIINSSVSSIHDANSTLEMEAIVMTKLTNLLPATYISVLTTWTHLNGLQLADPMYNTPEKIDLILGADVYGDLIIPEIRKGSKGAPIAQKTILGWIIIGSIHNESSQPTRPREIFTHFTETSVCKQLRQFWELEESSEVRKPTKNDELIESHFKQTHKRRPDGRYSVDLPFNTSDNIPPAFGNSRIQAFMRLRQVERRLHANPDLKLQYSAFMNEYIRLGHMKSINCCSPRQSFYLPHHAIIKPCSVLTKIHVVFDASAKDSNGIALNDTFLIGPTIQHDLFSILLRWRKYYVAITADVEKMYRQINVNQHHQPFQRILWRNEDGYVTDYELSTVTYGTACAPFLAIRTVQQLAFDEQQEYPTASSRTLTDMYVDDFISGGDTLQETQDLQREMVELFKKGGFNLRKWSSNSKPLLDNIPAASREELTCLDVCRDDIIKTLGIAWHTVDDCFHFVVRLTETPTKLTKRTLLSDVARLFDPIGFLAPIIITAKILFQSLWLKGLEWDDLLPEDIANEWQALRSNLNEVSTITIPRWIGTSKLNQRTEFHGFCDASTKAYAAVVFCRTEFNGEYRVQLLTSKTRVAPIKTVSLPNLELCGAALLANLIKRVQQSMEIDATVFAWTDSTIVLDWIKSNTHKKTFLANRVSTILDNLTPSQWHHVRSKENPADVASRGICPAELQNHALWWQGPPWLQKPMHDWPAEYKHVNAAPTIIDVHISTITECKDYLSGLIEKHSSVAKLLRVTAMCLKFARNCLQSMMLRLSSNCISDRSTRFAQHIQQQENESMNRIPTLSAEELREAELKIIQFVQLQNYSSEILLLNKSQSLGNSKISALYPFISKDDELLRVGERLRNANISFDQKHPILLHYHHFTKIMITKLHSDTLHGGLKLMLATLRQKYWVCKARTLIRATIHNCILCRRYAVNTKQQLMGSLPSPRVQPSRVFAHTGVDYAGPFDLRLSKHRGRGTYKGFVAVFICLSTKAIHLELASELTSDSFIAAFKRFTGRRGLCTDLYSDNGTNFVGANRKLQKKNECFLKEISNEAGEWIATKGIHWHFIPACSPHFGGLWEAGVKSFKHHLRRILNNTTLSYEELQTLLIQIEAVLNSRPLCPLSSDPNDINTLTPGHFLTGGPLNAIPEPSVLEVKENRLNRWQYLEKLNQDFWQSWTREYLAELQQRPKRWRKEEPNLQEGDIVLIKDTNLPPSNWPLARVIQTHPGDDGIVRAVTVKQKNGETKRAINKLCRLPISERIPQ